MSNTSNTLIAMALYRPHNGMEKELHKILESHIPALLSEGLITNRETLTLQASDGTIIEIFEWKSVEAKDKAHTSLRIREIWSRMMDVAEMTSLSTLAEATKAFPNFKLLH